MKAPPLITIKNSKILMPGDTTNIQVNLSDQKVITESLKSDEWPPPQLATIKNQLLTLTNTSNKPVIMLEKKAVPLKITPATITDTRKYSHTQPQLHSTKVIETHRHQNNRTHQNRQNWLKHQTSLGYSSHPTQKSVWQGTVWRIQRILWQSCLQIKLDLLAKT